MMTFIVALLGSFTGMALGVIIGAGIMVAALKQGFPDENK